MNLERAILLAILAMKNDPIYADQILRTVPQFTMARCSLADLHTALSELEAKGEVSATAGSREDAQGRPLLAYFLTPKGRNRAQS